jgi:hypothetical protein
MSTREDRAFNVKHRIRYIVVMVRQKDGSFIAQRVAASMKRWFRKPRSKTIVE